MSPIRLVFFSSAVFGTALFAACGTTTTIGDPSGTDGSADTSPGADAADPCEGRALPLCPRRCEAFPLTGACTTGDSCAYSEVGDACSCEKGTWACTVHPPLGLGCNNVCKGLGGADAGLDATTADATTTDASKVCDPSVKDPCASAEYCLSTDCKTGVCVPKPAETKNTQDPVCGCDDVTYWNDNVAAARGMSVKGKGECVSGLKCGGPGPTRACPSGFSCSMLAGTVAQCALQSVPGACWGMPKTCPTVVIGPNTRECGAARCTSTCELIKAESTYYKDVTCPQ